MSLLQAFILGITQGLTEFLPVSSSGHLVLMQSMLGIEVDQSILQNFDVVLHAGTLIAILIYFRSIWFTIIKKPFASQVKGEPPLLFLLSAATVPIILVGLFAADYIETYTRTPLFVGLGLLLTGIVLLCASFLARRKTNNNKRTWGRVMFMSIGQAIAILPGFSRSGWTLSFGIFAGMSPQKATETAFLMGAPAFMCAVVYTFVFGHADFGAIGMLQIMTGFVTAIASSLAVMHFFLLSMKKFGLWIWSIYLCSVGLILLSSTL